MFIQLKGPENISIPLEKYQYQKSNVLHVVHFGLMNNFLTAWYHKTNNFKTVLTSDLKFK